ncbi:protein of unknown function [Acidithiobacillus ferrivorans]|uniref:Uncharacterized protein n=1 Tax=Acidithiobacillus ferrivorans TaxID=160808 RepID=A0A060UTN3_9PROT|nr:hypothetical protein [Acidithiobacillus ferrivorans]CDQ11957.1 exported hypothetical protein [Acidithiobacillus ferrivorans]SMH65513.1 protein of unknown function [Acidithiobacillus ferrivorans]
MAILVMPLLKAFFLHILVALALLLVFCYFLPRIAFTLAYLLRHDHGYASALLVSAAVTRHQAVTWWRAVVMQKAVGAKARHQRKQA